MTALKGLRSDPIPENLDLAAIVNRHPWLRLRVGALRVLLRPFEAGERVTLSTTGYWVVRVVNRRDFERALSALS